MTAHISLTDSVSLLFCALNLAIGCLVMVALRRASVRDAATTNQAAAKHSQAALADLLHEMDQQRLTGDFSRALHVEEGTDVGQIAAQYNRVLQRAQDEIRSREDVMRALRTAEEKYRSIFENAVEGIFQTTPDGQYISANPALARIYGYNSVGAMLRGIKDIQHQLYVDPRRRQDFADEIKIAGVVRNFESQVFRADGEIIWISENARVVRDEQGNLKHYEGTVEDISERKLNEELRQQQAAGFVGNDWASTRLPSKPAELVIQTAHSDLACPSL